MSSLHSESKILSGSELQPLLQGVPGFSALTLAEIRSLGEVELWLIPQGGAVYTVGEKELAFWILVEGEVQLIKVEADGGTSLFAKLPAGDSFGEVPLLGGAEAVVANCQTLCDSTLLRIGSEGFWRMLHTCPTARRVVLRNMAHRFSSYTALQLQREKLVSLGMMAAGLMHELNNPGSAAKRAAAQLREILQALPETSLKLSQIALNPEQMECLRHLHEGVMGNERPKAASSLEEADAEEELRSWLEGLGVEHAWKLAPTLAAAGWRREDIECAQNTFSLEALTQTLQWLQGFVASMQSLTTIEESLHRVAELVLAVKRYAYEDKNTLHEVDVHEGIQGTLTILGHKLRHKQLKVEKLFAAALPKILTCGRGLNQVWTNLLDNAIDAAPEESRLTVRTWTEANQVCVAILDHGGGIPEASQRQIFRPFYTTKPEGVGTGLGLDIANRIVTGQYGGEISFSSEPGCTEFVVRLPIQL
jgi:signal transduction histidine kinase